MALAKNAILLGYNLKIVVSWGGRGDLLLMQGGGDSLHPPSRENPGKDPLILVKYQLNLTKIENWVNQQ